MSKQEKEGYSKAERETEAVSKKPHSGAKPMIKGDFRPIKRAKRRGQKKRKKTTRKGGRR